MTTCERCGSTEVSTRVLSQYVDDGLIGLPNIVLIDAAKELRCEAEGCGHQIAIAIPDPEGLEAAVAVYRSGLPLKLRGEEIRFLRHAMKLKAADIGVLLEVREETLSRWENDQNPISPQYEKLLRLLVGLRLGAKAPGVSFSEDEVMSMRLSFVSETKPEAPVMAFKRISVLAEKHEQEAWRKAA